MTGYSKFTDIEGVEHTLYFGMQAVEEFATRVERYLSANSFKIAVDMVYAGIANHLTKMDIAPMSYTQVYDLLEKLRDGNKESFEQQTKEIADNFWESKYGADYAEALDKVKKKVEKEIEEMLHPSSNTGKDSEDMD